MKATRRPYPASTAWLGTTWARPTKLHASWWLKLCYVAYRVTHPSEYRRREDC